MASRTAPRRSPRKSPAGKSPTPGATNGKVRGYRARGPHNRDDELDENDGSNRRDSLKDTSLTSDEDNSLLNGSSESYLDVVGDKSPQKQRKIKGRDRLHASPTPDRTLSPEHDYSHRPGASSPLSEYSSLYPSLDEFSSPEPEIPKYRSRFATPDSGTRKREKTTSPKARSPRSKGKSASPADEGYWVEACSLCVVFLVVVILWLFGPPLLKRNKEVVPMPSPDERDVMVKDFNTKMQELSAKFPSQATRLWSGLKSVSKRVIKDPDPIQPATSILVFSDSLTGSSSGDCIAKQFTDVLHSVYREKHEVVEVKSHLFHGEHEHSLKMLVDDEIRVKLDAGSKVVHIPNLHLMDGDTAKIFYSYSDNVNAPFKNVHFVFTLMLPGAKLNVDKPLDEKVEDFLSALWQSELDDDKFSNLWSRIGNNVVFIADETNEILNKYCK